MSLFGNYLGIKKDDGKGQKYSRTGQKATASTKCQKCMKLGHFTFECKNQREYKVRPTRTQILKNPKLRPELTASLPPRTEEMPKEGTAAAILAANEAKRAAKLASAKKDRRSSSSSDSSSGSSRSSSSGSSSSGSDSGSGIYSGSESGSERGDSRRRSRRSRSRSGSEADRDHAKKRRVERSPSDELVSGKGKGRAVERD